jgi:hypothetical protein
MKPDYDTQRAQAPLVCCTKCGQSYYMTYVPNPAVCVKCRRGK